MSTGQCDANYGIILLGDGKGSFSTLDPAISGLKIRGDVRDLSVTTIKGEDYLLVGRNGDAVQVYEMGR